MTSHHFGTSQLNCSPFQGLSPQDSAICAVIRLSYCFDNFIHRPSIELFIRKNFKRELLICLIAFDCLKRVISISFNALINGKHVKFNPIFVLFVEFVEYMYENSRIFASTCANSNPFSRFEEFILCDGLMDFCFEAVEKAMLADGLLCLGSFDHGLVGFACLALEFGHSC